MKTFDDLNQAERQRVLHHFREACLARQTQWEHERQIEQVLDGEVSDFRIADYAVVDVGTLTANDVRDIIRGS